MSEGIFGVKNVCLFYYNLARGRILAIHQQANEVEVKRQATDLQGQVVRPRGATRSWGLLRGGLGYRTRPTRFVRYWPM